MPEKYRRDFHQSLLEAFLITLLSELNRPSAADASRSPLVAEAEKLARTLLPDPELSVARLARALGCSADYLSRRFREERGLTLTAWITRERMELAKDLLADPRTTSQRSGGLAPNAPSYFIRVFDSRPTTPRAYPDNRGNNTRGFAAGAIWSSTPASLGGGNPEANSGAWSASYLGFAAVADALPNTDQVIRAG